MADIHVAYNRNQLNMSKEIILEKAISINADINEAWDALINPGNTKQYISGYVPVTYWNEGSKIVCKK